MNTCRLWLALGFLVLASTAIRSQTPQTHLFIPQTFYNTFSGAHPPALRIKPGDRVEIEMDPRLKARDSGSTEVD